jgi:hypothetical protein
MVAPAGAASVDVDPTALLTADVTATLTPPGGSPLTQTDSDTGGLAKASVSASAIANLPAGADEPARSAAGTADAAFTLAAPDALRLTGKTTGAIAPDAAFATAAHSDAVAGIDLPFTLTAAPAGAGAVIDYAITIDTDVTRNQKVTVLLDRPGGASLFDRVFDRSAAGALPVIASGSYRLRVIAGSEATNKGFTGESGSAQFDLRLRDSSGDADGQGDNAVPLPSAAGPGAAALSVLFAALAVRRARRRPA